MIAITWTSTQGGGAKGLLSQLINWLYSLYKANVNWPNCLGTTVATHPYYTPVSGEKCLSTDQGEESWTRQSRGMERAPAGRLRGTGGAADVE